jgi:hypothetical protein
MRRRGMIDIKYRDIIAYYESAFNQFGDTYEGVRWTKSQHNTDKRYQVMLEVIDRHSEGNVTLLDFGCGLSHLLEYIRRQNISNIEYSGLDISSVFIEESRRKFPEIEYYLADVLDKDTVLPIFDYVVMNGVFTVRPGFSRDEMKRYIESILVRMKDYARIGLAFNVMSKLVDWEREDLFHVGFDDIAEFLAKRVSRNFVIRHDYGLFEYTVYLYM